MKPNKPVTYRSKTRVQRGPTTLRFGDNNTGANGVVQDLNEHVAYLDKQIENLLKEIHDHIDKNPDLKQQRDLLVTIPGIAELTAARLLG